MAIEKVVPVKQESAATGGDAADDYELLQAPADPHEDALEARGYYIQNDTLRDTQVLLSRDASNNMTFVDGQTGPYTLTQLATGGAGLTANQHKALRQLIHFIDEGPAEDFATNAYKVTGYTSTIFPNSEIWYEDNTLAQKIVEKATTYSGILVATEQWKMYDTDGTTVLVTVTDTYTYSGLFETSRTRTIV